MKLPEAIRKFQELDQAGVYVFSRDDIQKMFPDEKEKALEKSLERLRGAGILEYPCKGVYINALAKSKKARVIEDIAAVLRRGSHSYVSLESILSEYGDISQIPVSMLTLMTTGRAVSIKQSMGRWNLLTRSDRFLRSRSALFLIKNGGCGLLLEKLRARIYGE